MPVESYCVTVEYILEEYKISAPKRKEEKMEEEIVCNLIEAPEVQMLKQRSVRRV